MAKFSQIQDRERGLRKSLTTGQIGMIAIGGAIGTGLFLGSKFAIGLAGPGAIVSYLVGGIIALLLMAALTTMTVQHPTPGSFGAYAEHYVSPLAGFLVRYMYWAGIVLAVGTEATAIGDYMQLWFPGVPTWIWMIVFPGILIAVNAMNVKTFGTLEYWFAMIKIFAIVAFIIVAAGLVFFSGNPNYGLRNWTADGGFMPNGLWGVWVAVFVAVFSYLSVEMIAVAAGEAKDPEVAAKRAFRSTIVRLVVFYFCTLALVLSLAPMSAILTGASPFVTVMGVVGIPYADSVLNFVVIVAALSAMNSQLYITTRIMFSMARAGDAPPMFGAVRANGVPLRALLISTAGIAVAAVVVLVSPESAFITMLSISSFAAIFTWFMIFVTFVLFRRRLAAEGETLKYRIPGAQIGAIVGAITLLALLFSTIFTEEFAPTVPVGLVMLAVFIALYFVVRPRRPAGSDEIQDAEDSRAPAG